jgi:vancomycin permeability regulator SanA
VLVNALAFEAEWETVYKKEDVKNGKFFKAYGVSADLNRYAGQSMRDLREILARNKDFAKCIFKPSPTYLGEVISVSGNGDLTNDK